MITKRCFICGAKENAGQCTNPSCPRYGQETSSKTDSSGESIQK